MAGASGQDIARGQATFAVDAIEATGDSLTVRGRWSGVRGMRFVRPTLVLGDRELLATLEHKPWAPDADPWVAAFPWDGSEPDLQQLWLSVAPSVTVPLGDQPAEPAVPAEDDSVRIGRLQSEVRFLRDETDHARREAERQRDNALSQLEEAIEDREAAVRTRARMETQRDEAREDAAAARAERDDALAGLAELRAHLDQVLLANRELQQQLKAKLAEAEPEPPGAIAARKREDGDDDEEPIGVRAIPAARAVSPELHRTLRAREIGASTFDVWAIRILGTVAAVCFILLLVMFLGLFF
jgi:hypothetical protein